MKHRTAIIIIVVSILCMACSGCSLAKANPNVPTQYSGLYDSLDSKLDTISAKTQSHPGPMSVSTVYFSELIYANANRGDGLFKPRAVQGVQILLDRLKAMGFSGVKVSIGYPVLTSGFPKSAEYIKFYKKVAEEVRKRDMKLFVATPTISSEPELAKIQVSYKGLTIEKLRKGLAEQAETIIENMHPDYLTICNEPSAIGRNTGLNLTPQQFAEVADYVANDVVKETTLLGAGAGSWDDTEYMKQLAKVKGLDYLDAHIYPVNKGFVEENMFAISRIASAANKRLVIGEAWLYKCADGELDGSIANNPKIFARDTFEFWETLDMKFAEAMISLSRKLSADFCSFYWIRYYYASLPYDKTTKTMKPAELFKMADKAATRNIFYDDLTSLGIKTKKLIAESK